MVDKGGSARLADFGLLTVVSDSTHPTTSTSSEGSGTIRWMSPELLDSERFGFDNARPTKESDCYALGMVILEILTGQVPFPCYNTTAVIRKVVDGECPNTPQGPEAVWFTDALWGLLKRCWSPQPKLRPTVAGVLEYLELGSATWEPLSLSTDNDYRVDSNDELAFTASRYPCVFFHSVFDLHSPVQRPMADEVIPQDGDKSRVVLQRHSGGADTNRGLSWLSPGTQQQPGESPVSTTLHWLGSSC